MDDSEVLIRTSRVRSKIYVYFKYIGVNFTKLTMIDYAEQHTNNISSITIDTLTRCNKLYVYDITEHIPYPDGNIYIFIFKNTYYLIKNIALMINIHDYSGIIKSIQSKLDIFDMFFDFDKENQLILLSENVQSFYRKEINYYRSLSRCDYEDFEDIKHSPYYIKLLIEYKSNIKLLKNYLPICKIDILWCSSDFASPNLFNRLPHEVGRFITDFI